MSGGARTDRGFHDRAATEPDRRDDDDASSDRVRGRGTRAAGCRATRRGAATDRAVDVDGVADPTARKLAIVELVRPRAPRVVRRGREEYSKMESLCCVDEPRPASENARHASGRRERRTCWRRGCVEATAPGPREGPGEGPRARSGGRHRSTARVAAMGRRPRRAVSVARRRRRRRSGFAAPSSRDARHADAQARRRIHARWMDRMDVSTPTSTKRPTRAR